MEQVKSFDRQLKQMYNDMFIVFKFLYILMSGIGAILMIIPIEKAGDCIFSLFLYSMAVYFYLLPYMLITENGQRYTIYEKLRYMPVSEKEIRAVRRGYLRQYGIPMTVINFIAGQLGMLTVEGWKMTSVTAPALTSVLMWLMGLDFIYMPYRGRRH